MVTPIGTYTCTFTTFPVQEEVKVLDFESYSTEEIEYLERVGVLLEREGGAAAGVERPSNLDLPPISLTEHDLELVKGAEAFLADFYRDLPKIGGFYQKVDKLAEMFSLVGQNMIREGMPGDVFYRILPELVVRFLNQFYGLKHVCEPGDFPIYENKCLKVFHRLFPSVYPWCNAQTLRGFTLEFRQKLYTDLISRLYEYKNKRLYEFFSSLNTSLPLQERVEKALEKSERHLPMVEFSFRNLQEFARVTQSSVQGVIISYARPMVIKLFNAKVPLNEIKQHVGHLIPEELNLGLKVDEVVKNILTRLEQ